METRAEVPASTPRPYRAWRSDLSGSAVRGPRRSTPFAASAAALGRAPERLGWSLPRGGANPLLGADRLNVPGRSRPSIRRSGPPLWWIGHMQSFHLRPEGPWAHTGGMDG